MTDDDTTVRTAVPPGLSDTEVQALCDRRELELLRVLEAQVRAALMTLADPSPSILEQAARLQAAIDAVKRAVCRLDITERLAPISARRWPSRRGTTPGRGHG